MRGVRGRFLLLVFLLSMTAVIVARLDRDKAPGSLDLAVVPLSVGNWNGREVAVGEDVKRILETGSVLLREYRNPSGASVGVAIVYYGDSGNIALHLPESCLMGKGSRLTQRGTERISVNGADCAAVRLVTRRELQEDIVIYYFQTGGVHTGSYLEFRAQLLGNALRGKKTGGALIRYSIPVAAGGERECGARLREFIRLISPALDSCLP